MNTNLKFYLLTCAICILLFITILAPYIVPFDPYEQNLTSTLQAPNTIHLLGTDKIWSRYFFSHLNRCSNNYFFFIISRHYIKCFRFFNRCYLWLFWQKT